MTARAFDSADVKFAFDRARDPKSTNAQKQIFAPIASIETPDPATVTIKLKETSGNFLYYLGWGDAVIVAPETAATNAANPVGTGPFKFKSWTRGDRVELVRNPDYWQKDKVKLDSVTFRFISDSAGPGRGRQAPATWMPSRTSALPSSSPSSRRIRASRRSPATRRARPSPA